MQSIKFLALNTVRHRHWMPLGGFRNFLDESVPEQIAVLLRQPYKTDEIVSVLIEGWRWKNYALQHTTEEIEAAAETIAAELKRRTEREGRKTRINERGE